MIEHACHWHPFGCPDPAPVVCLFGCRCYDPACLWAKVKAHIRRFLTPTEYRAIVSIRRRFR